MDEPHQGIEYMTAERNTIITAIVTNMMIIPQIAPHFATGNAFSPQSKLIPETIMPKSISTQTVVT